MVKTEQILTSPEGKLPDKRLKVPLREKITVQAKTGGVEAQVGAQVEVQVDLDILSACSEYPLSSSEIAAALGHKKLSGNVRKALSRLKGAGLLEYTIPDKPNSRLQKYRLTSMGKAVITENRSDEAGNGRQ